MQKYFLDWLKYTGNKIRNFCKFKATAYSNQNSVA